MFQKMAFAQLCEATAVRLRGVQYWIMAFKRGTYEWKYDVSDLKLDSYSGDAFSGKTIFAQVVKVIHPQQFRRCVARYCGNYKVKEFSCWDQFLCIAFAQLT